MFGASESIESSSVKETKRVLNGLEEKGSELVATFVSIHICTEDISSVYYTCGDTTMCTCTVHKQ